MTAKNWTDLGPNILLAAGLLVSTAISVWSSDAGWWVLSGPLLLALTLVAADVLAARSRGISRGPSWSAVISGLSLVLACTLIALLEPAQVAMMLPILGGGVAVAVLSPDRRKACRRI